MIHQWLILCTHGKKQQSHTGTLNQGCKFELKLKKSQLFCRTRKNSMSIEKKQLGRKAELVFCQPELGKRHIFAELEVEEIKLISQV